MIVTTVARLIATGDAARAVGVTRATLVRWWQQGLVTPAVTTAGGHARWDLDELRAQLAALRRGEQDS